MSDPFHTWTIRGQSDVERYFQLEEEYGPMVQLHDDDYGEGTQYIRVDLSGCSASIETTDKKALLRLLDRITEEVKALPEITKPTFLV